MGTSSKVQVGDRVMLSQPYNGNSKGKSGQVEMAQWDALAEHWGVRVRFDDGTTIYLTEEKLAIELADTVYEEVTIDPEEMEVGDVLVERFFDFDNEDYWVKVRRRVPKLSLPTQLGSIIQLGTGPIDPPAGYADYNTRMVLLRTGPDGWQYTSDTRSGSTYLSNSQVLVKAVEAGGYTLYEQAEGQKVGVRK